MYELLKDYLENNELNSYEKVDVFSYDEDGHRCEVRFNHNESEEDKLTLNLWDVLAYVNSKK